MMVNTSTEGETIETKIERIVNQNEPIEDGAPLIYTERKDGVKPEYDIRTDRWDIAVEAMNTIAKTNVAKRTEKIEKENKKEEKNDGKAEPAQTTE